MITRKGVQSTEETGSEGACGWALSQHPSQLFRVRRIELVVPFLFLVLFLLLVLFVLLVWCWRLGGRPPRELLLQCSPGTD